MAQVQVKLSSATGVIDQDLELELADQYTIKEIIQYLDAEGIIKFPANQIIVKNQKGQPIKLEMTLKILNTNSKIHLKLQKKGSSVQPQVQKLIPVPIVQPKKQVPVQKVSKQVEEPRPSQKSEDIKVNIILVDGIDDKTFVIKSNPTQSFDDFKSRLTHHIQQNNLADNWQDTEQISVFYNNKPFLKTGKSFSTLNIIKDNQLNFKIVRLYPGGSS